jgi:hypothetical protein
MEVVACLKEHNLNVQYWWEDGARKLDDSSFNEDGSVFRQSCIVCGGVVQGGCQGGFGTGMS